jgi:hypothetical protein
MWMSLSLISENRILLLPAHINPEALGNQRRGGPPNTGTISSTTTLIPWHDNAAMRLPPARGRDGAPTLCKLLIDVYRTSSMRVQFADILLIAAWLACTPWALAQAPRSSSAPIQLHPKNQHYFLYQGHAIVLLGSGEHYGAVINADFDYRRYLATLTAEEMNYTRVFPGSYVEVPAKSFGILRNDLAPAPGRFLAPWARSDAPGYTGGGNKFDLDRWNPAYFDRLRSFLADAENRGIIVELSLFSSHYGEAQWNVSPFNSANNVNQTAGIDWKQLNTLDNGNLLSYQEGYVRKIVREVNPYSNIIFEIANEPWSDRPVLADVINPYLPLPALDRFPNSVDLPDEATMAWQARVLAWITTEEASLPNKHLIAQNYCNFRFPARPLPGVSIMNFHYAYPEAASLNYGLGLALSYDETGFLGHDDSPYMRQAWNFLLSGGSAFNHLDYSFTVGHEDGADTAPNGPGGGSPELRRRLRILRDFLCGLPLVDLAPDTSTIRQAQGVHPRVLSSPHGVYAAYLDGNGPTVLHMNLPPGDYTFEWLDIDTGEVRSVNSGQVHGANSGAAHGVASFYHAGGKKLLPSPNFRVGIALLLRRSSP